MVQVVVGAPGQRLKVLTLNIWNRQGPWERRLPLIRHGLRTLAPDVVGLQEVLRHESIAPDQAHEVADGLGYHVAYGPAWDLGGGLHFGNAVLSRWPIASAGHLTLPGARSSPEASDGEEPRSLLHCEIEAPFGRLPLFVTHLSWKFHQGALRCRQVAAIAAHIAARAPVDAEGRFPVVLLGDFNAEPGSDEIRFLAGHHVLDGHSVFYSDCHRAAGTGDGATFCRRNPYAAQTREPDRRIDYVFVRGPDRHGRGEPLSCRVVLDEPIDGVWPTDHFGVLAELSITPEPLPVVPTG